MSEDRLSELAEACAYAAEGYEHLAEKVMPVHRKYLRRPDSLAKHDKEAEYAAEQARILRGAVSMIEAMRAEIQRLYDDADIALASHRKNVIEECAKVCDDASSDSEMRVYGKYFAAAIRALKEREAQR